MLALSIKAGSSIKIGPDIEVMVVKTSEGRVKLGITAPQDVRIVRAEIKDQ